MPLRSAIRAELPPTQELVSSNSMHTLSPAELAPNNATNEGRPLVSAVIVCYNQAHYLAEAIESVRTQEYPLLEIIVVDDGSTDATKAVVEAYPDVRYVWQQ